MAAPEHLRCAACGADERAAEGAPCDGCEAFLCIVCTVRGVVTCARCASGAVEAPAAGT